MGKKTATGLGNALIRSQRRKRSGGGAGRSNSSRHTAELNDGYDWAKLNLNSITEQSNLEEFLTTAQLAGTEFQAEKLNITFVNPATTLGILTPAEKKVISDLQKKHKSCLRVPRRPAWNKTTSAEELQRLEQDVFLEWRKELSQVEEIEGIILTPFEKNLEFWRQLWRVIERSDVVVQIVDARDPLLFWCEDLESYVKEVNKSKRCLVLINKADFLTEKQRKAWAEYFSRKGRKVVFFSALQELNSIEQSQSSEDDDKTEDDESEGESEDDDEYEDVSEDEEIVEETKDDVGKIYDRLELIDYFKTIFNGERYNEAYTTIGLVGYPNVGKSSTINTLLNAKKTSVSVTPGKTKHFQTLFVDEELCLCDCPGLVMPMFVSTKADMIISGILPIDQMRDYIQPVNLIASRFPRHITEETYGIIFPAPLEEEANPNRPPSAEEFLNSYAYMRGFMTQRGLPDIARGSRYIIKDYVCGKLLYCHAPPSVEQAEFHPFAPSTLAKVNTNLQELKVCQPTKGTSKDLDKNFFKKANPGVHYKNANADKDQGASTSGNAEKPWKKHNNRKKREKLRRLYDE